MKQCPKCNIVINDSVKFCPNCGFNIKKYYEENNNLYCTECGMALEPEAEYCTECGAKVNRNLLDDYFQDDDFLDLTNIENITQSQVDQKKMVESLSSFEIVEHNDGTYTITGLKDKFAMQYIVPDSVVSIADHAFEGCNAIEVKLSNTIMQIGKGAFKDCLNLCKINLPNSLKIIGDEAFANCELLDIVVPSSVIRVGKDALKNTIPDKKAKEKARKETEREADEEKARLEAARIAAEEKARKETERKAAEEKTRLEAERKVAEEKAKWNIGGNPTFGSYYKDSSNKKEPIEWLVLKRENNKALIITKYGIDCKRYNEEYEDVTWETCTLRKWLNNTFYNNAFLNEEKNRILNTRVHTLDNSEYSTKGGNDTNDKVFLLSIEEAEEYFSSNESRRCKPTTYSRLKGRGIYVSGYDLWWLRSSGIHLNDAVRIDYDGSINSIYGIGTTAVFCDLCVRPALWINIE